MVPSGMSTLLFDGSPVGMAPSWGRMEELVAPESRTAWCFVHHAWSDCFSSPISSHCWISRLTYSCGLKVLNNFSSAHSWSSDSSLTVAVCLSFTWRFLIWRLLIIWSCHLTFFFDKYCWFSAMFELMTSRCAIFFLTWFELKPLIASRICNFFLQRDSKSNHQLICEFAHFCLRWNSAWGFEIGVGFYWIR